MRIRSLKPEFCSSESVGRLSRDARLLFVNLLLFADDSGRGRGNLHLISGALYPFDRDALELLPNWIAELEREGMVRRYVAEDGNTYFDIPNFLKHQKIDKPSKSRLPAYSANPPRTLPEPSAPGSRILDLGSRTKDLGSQGILCPEAQNSTSLRGGVAEAPKAEPVEPAKDPAPTEEAPTPRKTAGRSSQAGPLRILTHLNETAGRQFRPTNENLGLIEARLAEVENDVEGVLMMVSRQVARWGGDPEMQEFLRPETLFRKSKFASYYDCRKLALPNRGTDQSNSRNRFVGGQTGPTSTTPETDDVDFSVCSRTPPNVTPTTLPGLEAQQPGDR